MYLNKLIWFLESSQGGRVHQLGFMAFGLAVQKFLDIEWFLDWKLKLNRNLKISEALECAFGVIGKILMSRI
jgi:hypothetical protein